MQKIWKVGMLYRAKQGTRGDFQEAVRKTKVVWICKERREEGSMPQRGKSAVE